MLDVAFEREVIALFEILLSVPSSDQRAWLDDRTQGRVLLRRRLEAMLRANQLAGDALARKGFH